MKSMINHLDDDKAIEVQATDMLRIYVGLFDRLKIPRHVEPAIRVAFPLSARKEND